MITIKYDGVNLTDPQAGWRAEPPEDFGAPPVRGADLIIPFKHGAVATKKYYDSRIIVINGYVWAEERQTLWARIDRLKQLFTIADKGPRKLEFTWPDGTTRYLMAEPKNTLGFTGTHVTFSPFSIEFACADPFWRDEGAAQEKPYRLNDPQRLRLGDPRLLLADKDASFDAALIYQTNIISIPNPGVVPIDSAIIKVRFSSSVTNLNIICPATGTQLKVTYPFVNGDVAVIDCNWWTVTINSVDKTDLLTTGLGQRAPIVLPVGSTNVVFSFDGYTGDIRARLEMKYSAAYL